MDIDPNTVIIKMIHEDAATGLKIEPPYLAISIDGSDFWPINEILDLILRSAESDFLKREAE